MQGMMVRVIVCFIVLCIAFSHIEAIRYSRCSLAKALLQKKGVFTRKNINDWVCLVEKESSRDTSKIGGPNKDSSKDFGLFQINSRYWCGIQGVGGDCKIKCDSLTGARGLDVGATCATKVYNRHGFTAWYGWKNGCKGKKLPNVVNECKL